ncbi:hypothetical protein [Megasphaera sp.]|uniref:hypothetical protein n=1 Tax=Megasphaera sp. TaxID=2023260 RepID=UPI0027BB0228|nr:hypothetical protein [Megasphaera sp.]
MEASNQDTTKTEQLSTQRPTQLSEIYVRQQDFEDSFIANIYSQCDDIEKNIDLALQACRKLINRRFVKMKNKQVWYDRDTASLYPQHDKVTVPHCEFKLYDGKLHIYEGVENFDYESKVLTVDGIKFVLASPEEAIKTFRKGNGNPYLDREGRIANYPTKPNPWGRMYFVAADYDYKCSQHMRCYDTCWSTQKVDYNPDTSIFMVMIARLEGADSTGLGLVKTMFAWLRYALIPEGLSSEEERVYNQLLSTYQILEDYLDWTSEEDKVHFRRDAFIDDVQQGRFRQDTSQGNGNLSKIISNIRDGMGQLDGSPEWLRQNLLNCDYRRANLEPYAESTLYDINKGHWELFEAPEADALKVSLAKDQVWTARPPQLDVVANGTCAIDFGTKSSVVVCRGEGGTRLLRIGTGDFTKAVEQKDYENPTVVELRDLDSFEKAYRSRTGRPFTAWEDVTVSHQAEQALLQQDVDSSVYYAVFSELKQWAHEKDRRLLLKDRKGKVWKLNPYLELDDDALDPIEIYAYYLGLYINNMRHGIYLDYILSFPVNYDLAIRTKLLKSFERGLKKSLPPAILADEDRMRRFRVYAGASEPAAYAAAALQAYGLEPAGQDDMTAYGVFDFGGGTTDFDFGIEKRSANPRRHKFELHQFGRGGDPYLGGENLLNVLAFEVFCANLETMRENAIPIALPHGCTAPAGTETLILAEREATQISFMNRKCLAEALRPIWEERPEEVKAWQDKAWSLMLFTDGKKPAGRKDKQNSGEEGSQKEREDNQNRVTVKLTVDVDALKNVIRRLISRGVTNFFEAWKTAFKHQTEEPDTLHILLAGNSCRSSVVKELFEEQIAKESQEISDHAGGKDAKGMLVLHMPLGMEEDKTADGKTETGEAVVEAVADAVQALREEQSGERLESAAEKTTEDRGKLDQKLTGKTGVAFGLLRSRKGGKDIKIINDNVDDSGEALFPYFLGDIDADGHFCVRIGKGVPYQHWAEFCYADEEDFEIYYTAEPQALEGQLPQDAVKYVNCRIDEADVSDDDNHMIFLRKVAPDAIEYAVGIKDASGKKVTIEESRAIRQTLR